ncbi:MAG: hypothetical protein EXR07_12230 [Acetobacteraceae bacterium]|nr:hypothetical protein [Acetobacteraceae bacterium]
MAFVMDTLGYAKRLRECGIPTEQAEAHAEAAREFIMLELVTKTDLEAAVATLREEISGVRRDQDTGLAGVRRDFRSALDIMGLRLTVRLGAMLGLAVAALAALIKL